MEAAQAGRQGPARHADAAADPLHRQVRQVGKRIQGRRAHHELFCSVRDLRRLHRLDRRAHSRARESTLRLACWLGLARRCPQVPKNCCQQAGRKWQAAFLAEGIVQQIYRLSPGSVRQGALTQRDSAAPPYLHGQAAQLSEVAKRLGPCCAAQLAGLRGARADGRGGAHVPQPVLKLLQERLAAGSHASLCCLQAVDAVCLRKTAGRG